MKMTQQDMDLCKGLIKSLKSGKYSNFNALFLNPFDLSHTPGYLDVCGRVMDLSTLSQNIENGFYSSRNQVYEDCNLIFENAIRYHSDKDTTKWIIKPAQQMLKIAKREQQKIEKKVVSSGGTATSLPKIKLKLGASGGDKPKIKIKQPAARATGATISRGKTPPTGAVGVASRGKTSPTSATAGSSSSPSVKAPLNKKPRLTLKLGLGKSKTTSESSSKNTQKAVVPASVTTTKKSNASPKISLKTSAGSGGSRGKELPKGVTQPSTGKALPKGVTVPSTAETNNKAATGTSSGSYKVTKATKTSGSKPTGAKASIQKATTPKSTIRATAATTSSNKPKTSTTKGKPKGSKAKSVNKKEKNKFTLKASSAYKATAGGLPMTPSRKAQCYKILNGIKRRKAKNIVWFEKPVSDKKLIQDYKAKIKYPMDLSTMQTKLDNTTFGPGGTSNTSSSKGYTTVAAFVWDLRRIFGNCLRYNTTNGKDSLRPIAVETLDAADQLCTFFLAKHEYAQNATAASATPLYPPLLFCWKLCVNVIDTLYNLTNPQDGNPTAYYFMHPVSFFFGGTLPVDYLHKAPNPMDFGTVTSQLMEGQYTTLDQFESDCKLVISNCMAYYGEKTESKSFCDQAQRLNQVLQQQLDALNRYVKSSAGLAAANKAKLGVSTATLLPKPPMSLLLKILADLREQKYTDKATKITEPAMANFEKPVSVAVIPDYMQYVQSPMDLQTVDRKIRNVQYTTPEDFEYDMVLMFQNCITYNSARKMDHLVALGRFGLKSFRRIFSTRMKVLDDPSSAKPTPVLGMSGSSGSSSIRKDPPTVGIGQGPSKKIKLSTSGSGKAAPRISLSAATLSEAQKAAAKSKSNNSIKLSTNKAKSNQPVPLHIAIAQVKERFPLRRDVKTLQSWEASCARFFKELKRHPWISAARPKFVFNVPVPVLFPGLREAYGMKIKKPMDLTTAECTLLAGNRYTAPEDFVNDVALVFANAICFNKDARDVGDPLSCAYYDASIHLLKYTRWLSLEILTEHFEDDEYIDEPEDDGLPLKSWKLTKGNQKMSRSEMEKIVLNEPLEKSLEGDRFTWMEAECEKLLKALRHQSDNKYMTFFVHGDNFPPDYSAFISRPMYWEKVQKTLKKRNYDTFRGIIEDLRLIFTNALKYNAKYKNETETVSGKAFEGARVMSKKLEIAINKLMVTVSDRVERERIDHNNAEREIEAEERRERERIRAQWKSESAGEASRDPVKVEGSLRVRSSIRLSINRRQSDTDFEVPFFEEEYDGQHDQSLAEVMKEHKATFERQRNELVTMQKSTQVIGQSVYNRMLQSARAREWISDEQSRLGIMHSTPMVATAKQAPAAAITSPVDAASVPEPSSVSAMLSENDRDILTIKLTSKAISKQKKKMARKRKRAAMMDWGDDDE
ncbi:unnamed protein product [Pseudo-nitzschia multistriata]|uniref:Bromo domain-containing protein n=1 Tax=Pseudo-nitzschia multistriata TaxID=183589 RepID=A0A448ZDV0_9STRA|nr:unnamed protein product [Pseudo-nitzschia multistriata]